MREPDFDQVLTALRCGQPDYTPTLELFHDIEVKEAYLGRPITTLADDIEFHRLAGYDHYGIWMRHPVFSNPDRPQRKSAVVAGAYGGETTRTWVDEHGGQINSMADFDAFPWPDPDNAEFIVGSRHVRTQPLEIGVDQIAELLPEGMGLILSSDGIYERFSKGLMGYENFCYALYDNPDLVAAIFEKVGELWLTMYTRAAACPAVKALWLADDIAFGSGLLFSREIMRDHLFPWYKKIGDVCARSDKPFIFHSDGDLRPVIDDLIACGVSALHPIEPAAMSIDEIKTKYRGRLCLVGNIDLGSTLTMGTPAEVRQEVKARIESVGPGGGYCVGSSNSVTNYVPLENFKAMLDATFEYGAAL